MLRQFLQDMLLINKTHSEKVEAQAISGFSKDGTREVKDDDEGNVFRNFARRMKDELILSVLGEFVLMVC